MIVSRQLVDKVRSLRTWFFAWSVCAVLLMLSTACGSTSTNGTSGKSSGPKISVTDAWARPAPASATESTPSASMSQSMGSAVASPMTGMAMGSATPGMGQMEMASTSAIYLVIHNAGSEGDELTSASTSVAKAVELHQSVMENGVMAMKPVTSISVPAGGTAKLQPGGYHIMLIDLVRDLNAGDHFDVTLTFAHSGTVTVSVEVRQQ